MQCKIIDVLSGLSLDAQIDKAKDGEPGKPKAKGVNIKDYTLD